MTDEKWRELTAKALKGDSAAFEELYNASKRSVYFICSKMLKSDDDAKDAVQNTYITAYQKLSSLDDGANFLKWINGIAANKCKEFFHGKALDSLDEKLEEGIEFADEEFIPEDYITDMERRRIIMHIIETELSDVQRQTVILYYYNQLTVSQIADEMSCPENTVKYRLCAAREKIREAVLIYEKEHDDRLHAIVPIPVLTRIFRTEAEQISVPDIPLHLPKANSAPANTLLKKAGGSKMKNAIAGKIIAGVVALGVIGGGIAIAVNSSKDKEPTEVKAPVQIEESSTLTEATEPITDESAETTVTEATTTTAAGSTTPEDTSESFSVSENENEDSDYNFWRLGSTKKIATVYFDSSAWEVSRYRDKAKSDLILPQLESKEGLALQLLNQEKRCAIDVTYSEWTLPDYSAAGATAMWAGGSFEEHIKINADALRPFGGLEVKDIETQQVNGYETIIIHYAYEYPDDPSYNEYYTSYYLILEEALTMNFGLEQVGSESDETFAEFMKVIDSLKIK